MRLRNGFAVALVVALTVALATALVSAPPTPVPAWALNSAAVWRAEVGLVIFGVLYLASVAVLLGLQGRGFTKFSAGPAGVEAAGNLLVEATDDAQEAIAAIERSVEDLTAVLDRHEARLDSYANVLRNLRARVGTLERGEGG